MKRLALVLALIAGTGAAATVEEPEGYRGPPYKAPVPETLAGAPGVSAADVQALHQTSGATFIDVLPHTARPEGLPEGTLWRSPQHLSIPSAIWLPGVGYEALAPEVDAYFRNALQELTAGDVTAPILFFCRRDCWMSWNAARRAQGYGYTGVLWFPEGQDGWEALGQELVPVSPYPGAP